MSAFPTQLSGDGSRGSRLGAAAGHQTRSLVDSRGLVRSRGWSPRQRLTE